MSLLRQIAAVTSMNLRSIPQRFGSSCVIVIGIAGVVGVLVSVLGIATSLTDAMLATGRADRAIVLRNGSNTEVSSALTVDETLTILAAPGIARGAGGKAVAAIDMVTGVNLTKRVDGAPAGIAVRGTSDRELAVRPEIELVEGRMFETGLRELVVGRSARDEFVGLELGDRVALRDSEWTVVGTFTSGNALESTLLTDVDMLLSTYQRAGGSSVTVMLESADAFDVFRDAVTTDPTLSVEVTREPEYYAERSDQLGNILTFVSYFVGGIMAVGAVFAALNTMYSAVSSRSVEIATLRAIGFGSSGVVVSVLSEALLLSLIGAAIGAGAAWVLFNGSTISFAGDVASIVFERRVTPALVLVGVVWACTVGFFGGLLPAVRAARLPVATALRSI